MNQRTRILIPSVLILAIIFAATGCMTVDLASDSSTPVMMSGVPDRDYTIVRSFETSHRSWFSLFDLVTVQQPEIQRTLDAELKRNGGDAIINVRIEGQTTFVDGLIPVGMTFAGTLIGQAMAPDAYTAITYGSLVGSLTGAMLSARTYTISGDVIRYRE